MKLYYVKTMFQFLCAVADKTYTKFHEPSAILVNSFIKQKIVDIDLLQNYFKVKVVEYNTDLVTAKNTNNSEQWLKDIKEYYDTLLADNQINIDDYDTVHVFAALRFSLYLCLKKKKFFLHEDANGSASKNGFVQWREQTDAVNKREIAAKFNLLDASSEWVEKAYCKMVSQTKSFSDKVVNYDIVSVLNKLEDDVIDKIIRLFTNQRLMTEEKSNLILTQYYFEDKKIETNEKERAHLYLNICNYFAPKGKVFIKPHPADNINYSKYFSANILDKYMPSELLISCKNLRFGKCITVSSSSIDTMRNISDETLTIGNNIRWIIQYGDLLQAAIHLYSVYFNDYCFMHYGLFNADVDGFLSMNSLPPSVWYRDDTKPRFIVVGDRIWGKNKTELKLHLNCGDIVVLMNRDEWATEIEECKNLLLMSVSIEKFLSKAVILCGSDAVERKIAGVDDSLPMNIGKLKIDVSMSVQKRLKILENKIALQEKEIELLKEFVVKNLRS